MQAFQGQTVQHNPTKKAKGRLADQPKHGQAALSPTAPPRASPPALCSIHRTVASSCPLRKAIAHRDGCVGALLFLLLFRIETACSAIRTAGVHSQPAVHTLKRGPHKTHHHSAGRWGSQGRAQSGGITVSEEKHACYTQQTSALKEQAVAATNTSSNQSGLSVRTSFLSPHTSYDGCWLLFSPIAARDDHCFLRMAQSVSSAPRSSHPARKASRCMSRTATKAPAGGQHFMQNPRR